MEDRNTGNVTTFGEALSEARQVVLEMQNLIEVECPHPDCKETAVAPASDTEAKIKVTRSAALLGDYEKVHCSAGHKAFVHYCRSEH
jgi:hypothetical protein